MTGTGNRGRSGAATVPDVPKLPQGKTVRNPEGHPGPAPTPTLPPTTATRPPPFALSMLMYSSSCQDMPNCRWAQFRGVVYGRLRGSPAQSLTLGTVPPHSP